MKLSKADLASVYCARFRSNHAFELLSRSSRKKARVVRRFSGMVAAPPRCSTAHSAAYSWQVPIEYLTLRLAPLSPHLHSL